MSNTINSGRPIGTAQPVNTQDVPSGKKFTPAPDAAKVAQQSQPLGSSSISAVIAEATDGDAQEASALAKLGRAKPDGVKDKPDDRSDDDDGQLKTRRAMQAQPASRDQDRSADAERVQAKANATVSADKIETVKAARFTSESVAESHDQVMLVTGSMDRHEIVSHLSAREADEVSRLLQDSPAWKRDPDGSDRLVATQMRPADAPMAS